MKRLFLRNIFVRLNKISEKTMKTTELNKIIKEIKFEDKFIKKRKIGLLHNKR